jgi:hypothetical protein
MEEYIGRMISLPMVPLGAVITSITPDEPFEGRDVIKIEFSSNNGSSMFYFKDEFIKNVRFIESAQSKAPALVNQLEVDVDDVVINKATGKEWTVRQIYKSTTVLYCENSSIRVLLTDDKWSFKND